MTRLVALLLFLLAAALTPAAAQDSGRADRTSTDKVRLDDFALPAGAGQEREATRPMAQIAPAEPRGAGPPNQLAPPDRARTVPQLASDAPSAAAPPPLGEREGATPVAQLARAAPSAAAPPPLSGRGDSAPGAAVALTGADRCDPQRAAARELARCRRILELRAGEFSAAEAPTLSAEQRLLIEQQARERRLSSSRDSPARMARIAEDPEEAGNQEIASVVLGTAPETMAPPDPLGAGAQPADLGTVIQAIVTGLTTAGPVP